MQDDSNSAAGDLRSSQGRAAPARNGPGLGLSAKLLLLTALFVMLAEILIFVPSIANYRVNWLMQRLQASQIAALAAEAAPGGELPRMLREELLMAAGVRAIAVRRLDAKLLVVTDQMPTKVDAAFDLTNASAMARIVDALAVFVHPEGTVIRVMGQPEMGHGELIDIVMHEAPLRAAMITYSLNILALSVIISLIAAALVYLALHWLLVRPMRRITISMMEFRADPENPARVIVPSRRTDEVGMAETELASMQRDLAQTLQQKNRLAQLGLAVSKINHDLRNMLSSAQLISDRLGAVDDPTVQRATPKLVASLDRAIKLCTDTLRYGRAVEPAPERRLVPLRPLVQEVGEALDLPRPGRIAWQIEVDPSLLIDADPDQLFRILSNLANNATQVLESSPPGQVHAISVAARRRNGSVAIEVRDDGPGVPPRAREHLFSPFQGSARKGGTGLGLAIVAELVRGHGGNVELVDGAPGAIFRVEIPDRP